VELIDVCDLEIEYCNACQVGFKTGTCTKKDDFQGLYDNILASDAIVWGSSNYFHSVTAQMKALIDRMAEAVHCQLLTGKYCCVAATGGSNHDQVTEYLAALMMNFGAFVTGSVGAAMSQGLIAWGGYQEGSRSRGRTGGGREGSARLRRAASCAAGAQGLLQSPGEDAQRGLGARVRVLEQAQLAMKGIGR
jgi:multimeric flavodoxin WrbA